MNLHNEFRIEKYTDGVLVSEAHAYNLVTNIGIKFFGSANTGIRYLAYGSGTEAPSPSNSRLTVQQGLMSLDNPRAVPVYDDAGRVVAFSKTFQTRLRPETYVGAISEVGLSSSADALLTHALLRDSAGGLMTIDKGEFDEIFFYARVYVSITNTDEMVQLLSHDRILSNWWSGTKYSLTNGINLVPGTLRHNFSRTDCLAISYPGARDVVEDTENRGRKYWPTTRFSTTVVVPEICCIGGSNYPMTQLINGAYPIEQHYTPADVVEGTLTLPHKAISTIDSVSTAAGPLEYTITRKRFFMDTQSTRIAPLADSTDNDGFSNVIAPLGNQQYLFLDNTHYLSYSWDHSNSMQKFVQFSPTKATGDIITEVYTGATCYLDRPLILTDVDNCQYINFQEGYAIYTNGLMISYMKQLDKLAFLNSALTNGGINSYVRELRVPTSIASALILFVDGDNKVLVYGNAAGQIEFIPYELDFNATTSAGAFLFGQSQVIETGLKYNADLQRTTRYSGKGPTEYTNPNIRWVGLTSTDTTKQEIAIVQFDTVNRTVVKLASTTLPRNASAHYCSGNYLSAYDGTPKTVYLLKFDGLNVKQLYTETTPEFSRVLFRHIRDDLFIRSEAGPSSDTPFAPVTLHRITETTSGETQHELLCDWPEFPFFQGHSYSSMPYPSSIVPLADLSYSDANVNIDFFLFYHSQLNQGGLGRIIEYTGSDRSSIASQTVLNLDVSGLDPTTDITVRYTTKTLAKDSQHVLDASVSFTVAES